MNSGLIVSGPLGVQALRRFYQTEDGEFPIRQIAKEALIAGNDLLLMEQGADSLDEDASWDDVRVNNIESTIIFFQEQYENDLDFADRVDEALRHILRTKVRLYTDEDALKEEATSIATEAALSATQPITDSEIAIATPAVVIPETLSTNLTIPMDRLLITRTDLSIFESDGSHISDSNALMRQIARESLSVLYPDITEPSESLPPPPTTNDQIVIFTDSRLQQECSDCRAEVAIGPDDVQNIILRLYGPDATNQITADQIHSLTFAELDEVLDASAQTTSDAADSSETEAVPLPTPTLDAPSVEDEIVAGEALTITEGSTIEVVDRTVQIEQLIDEANWLVFAMLDVEAEAHPSSDVVKRFLSERTEQIEDKETVVLALNAPYFLDATEISGLSSYLGVYSHSTPFLENAVRAIFRNHVPTGAPPVSVPGTRFADLSSRLQPDPEQRIEMVVTDSSDQPLAAETEDGVEPSPSVNAGETVRIKVGPVLDRNGRPVPDGVPVEFLVVYDGVEMALNVEPVDTRNGMAIRDISLEQSGMVRISASSQDAHTGEPYLLMVEEEAAPIEEQSQDASDGAVAIESIETAVPPTAEISEPEPAIETDVSPFRANLPTTGDRVNIATLVISTIVLLGMLGLLLIIQVRILPRTAMVHNMLWTVIVGLAVYVMYGVGLLPGANMIHFYFGLLAAPLVVFVGMIGTMLWLQLKSN